MQPSIYRPFGLLYREQTRWFIPIRHMATFSVVVMVIFAASSANNFDLRPAKSKIVALSCPKMWIITSASVFWLLLTVHCLFVPLFYLFLKTESDTVGIQQYKRQVNSLTILEAWKTVLISEFFTTMGIPIGQRLLETALIPSNFAWKFAFTGTFALIILGVEWGQMWERCKAKLSLRWRSFSPNQSRTSHCLSSATWAKPWLT